jgi:hypothetical protein
MCFAIKTYHVGDPEKDISQHFHVYGVLPYVYRCRTPITMATRTILRNDASEIKERVLKY